jgi:hypothetical protein
MDSSSFGGSNRAVVVKIRVHVFHPWLPIARRIKDQRPQPGHPVGAPQAGRPAAGSKLPVTEAHERSSRQIKSGATIVTGLRPIDKLRTEATKERVQTTINCHSADAAGRGYSTERPTLLVLQGFLSAGHIFRDLIAQFAGQFHVIAPDLPGFGH